MQFQDISKHCAFLLGDIARMRLVFQRFFNVPANGRFFANEKRTKSFKQGGLFASALLS
jgi:hypothetical protein